MTPTFKTSDEGAVVADAEKLLRSGADHELVLNFLREKGFDKIASIKALVGATGMPLREAKLIVHNSKAWRDVYERDEQFHQELGNIADKLEQDGRL
jgi:ribosomal protein L7/L12